MMTPRPLLSFLLIVSGFVAGCGSMTARSSETIFTISDPAGDDYGNGALTLPMNEEIKRGELDLTSLAAHADPEGTRFVAIFAKPIQRPGRRTVDAIGTSLDTLARYGFYTMNLDIYIDTDRQSDSGSLTMVPGRKAMLQPGNGWERAIILTPDPNLAREEMRRLLVKAARRESRESKTRQSPAEIQQQREELRSDLDTYLFFPEDILVIGNRIEFTVPNSFLGERARPDWAYTIAVSGADIVQRTDQERRFLSSRESEDRLLILPIESGRPLDRFGGGSEDDPDQPPLVDIVVPSGSDQRTVMNARDEQGVVRLPAVIPAGR